MTPPAPLVSLILSAVMALAPTRAMDPEAKERLERGLAGYKAKEYASAIKDFRVAYALDPRSEILFAWAQAERMYGRCSQATKLYQRFLDSKPSKQQGEAARQGLERCKGQPDTTPLDPEDEPEAAPEPEPEVAPEPEPEPEPEPPPPPPKRKVDGVGIGLLAAGVAVAATGAGLLGVAQGKASDLAEGAPGYDEFADGAGQVRNLRIAGGVLAGVGSALLIGGVVKLITGRQQSRRDMSFWSTPHGAGLTLRLRF